MRENKKTMIMEKNLGSWPMDNKKTAQTIRLDENKKTGKKKVECKGEEDYEGE